MKYINDILYIILDKMTDIYYNYSRGGLILKNKKMMIARLECDLSQAELAKKVGVSRQTIGLIESGEYNPTLKLCKAICIALGKTLDDLFWN